jgi:hypothetical protein
MLAGTDPQSPLDTRRLSKFSPKPENLHGARSVRRTPPHHRGGVKPGSTPITANHRSRIRAAPGELSG